MKRFFLLSVILLALINWIHTEAQAQNPTVTITPPSGIQTAAFNVTITFSQPVNNFRQGKITLSPSTLASETDFTGSNGDTTYTAEITPTAGQQGTLTITVPEGAGKTTISTRPNQAASATVEVDTKPPTLTITPPSGTQTGAFDVTFDFGEAVNGFTDDDITLDAGARVTSLIGSNGDTSYTATITPKVTGDITISVAAAVATDAAGHDNTASSTHTVTVDLPHVIMVMEPDEDGPHNEAFDVMIMFTETVHSFTDSDITLRPSGLASVTRVSGRPPTYTATITPADKKTGDLEISVAENAVQDSSSMNYPESNEVTVMIDTERPTVTEIDAPSDPQSSAFDVTIMFSEDVTDFEDDDIDLGGSANATASVSGSGTSYTVTITPSSSGNLTIDVEGNAAEDEAGNKSAASSQASVTIDVDAPTVTISNAPTGPEKDMFTVDITFSEDVDDFDENAITLSPSGFASVTDVSGSGASYTATITPTDGEQGDVAITVEANAVEDDAGNGNEASTSVTVAVDRREPTLRFSDAPNTPQKDPFDITITVNEDVTDFDADDITLSIISGTDLVTVSVSGSGASYTARITPKDNREGTGLIIVRANAVTDTAGNANTTSPGSGSFEIDTIVPTVTGIAAPSDPQNSAFDITIGFSENVNGFEASDITLGGSASATASLKSGSDGDAEYTVTITPSSSGNLTVEVDGDAVTDEAGNKSAASSQASVTIDQDAPTVTISNAPAGPEKDSFDVTITFTENVTGFAAGDITLSDTGLATVSVSGSGPAYTATITPTDGQQGDLTIQVEAGVVEDTAGNDNEASNSVTVAVDKKNPTISFSGISNTPQKDPFDVTITFNEDVTDFAAGDITLSPSGLASVTSVSGSGAAYTATITPEDNKQGNGTIRVKANAVTDTAGNSNDASGSVTVKVDKKNPTISFSGIPNTPQKDPFDVTITFNEDVTGFAANDITLSPSGLATVSVSGTGAAYTARITPEANKDGNLTISVKVNSVWDLGGNRNVATDASNSVHIDTIAPTVSSITNVPTTEQKDAFDVTITFSETVIGFTKDDITVTGEATATATSGSDASYTATITPNANKEGDITVKVKANAVTDNAGNNNTVSDASDPVHIDTMAPTVVITNVPSGKQKNLFNLTITFSENVTGFLSSDITLSPSGLATAAVAGNSGDSEYIVIITPTNNQQGDVTIQVKANAGTDTAGNGNEASNSVTAAVDKKKPTVSLSGIPNTPQKDPFDLTITFSEDVTGFEDDDIALNSSTLATVSVAGSGVAYTATITPEDNKEGDLTLTVNANTVKDAAQNDNTASNTATIHIDTIVPTVAISNVPGAEQKDPFDVTITFSETVTGFTKDDITVTGEATATATSGSGTSYTATITPNASEEGDITLQVKANAVTDTAGNSNTDASDVTDAVHIDTIAPTVEITGIPDQTVVDNMPTNEPIDLTFTFSEPVSGFEVGDIQLSASIVSLSLKSSAGDGSVYVVTFTPNANVQNTFAFRFPSNRVQDLAGNGNEQVDWLFYPIDTLPPTVEIGHVPLVEMNFDFDLTITFNEEVSGFEVGDLTVTGPASVGGLSAGIVNSDDEEVYRVTITPNPASEGDVTVQVNANAVTDAALNSNGAASNIATIHIDTIIPTVEISGVPPPLPEKNIPFDLTITFNEPVNGFAASDITFTGPATLSLSGAEGDAVYTATITPDPTSEGDVTVQVNAAGVQDFALNDNTASNTVLVHVDTIIPTVEISGVPPPLPEKNIPFDLTITCSEAVNGFAATDLTLTGPATASLASGSDGDSVYTVTITPNATDEGDVTIQVNANAVQDPALNGNTASTITPSVHVDTIIPTVEISGVPPPLPEKNIPFDLTITFNEPVNGFAASDITFTGPATLSLSGAEGDAVYTATITPDPTSEGDVTVQVNANAVQDFALNTNTAASNTVLVHVDTIIPTVEISGVPPPLPEKNIPFDLTITCSEAVNGFAATDLTLTGPATASLASGSDGDSVYTVTITPNATDEGDVTIQVNANAVQDLALNANTAASAVTPSVHVDTIVPTVQISGTPTTEQNAAFNLTITFNEPVNGFAAANLTLTGPAAASLTSGVAGASVYTVTITPTANQEGSVTVQVNAAGVQDFALNNNTASNTVSVHVDTIVPTVVISGVPDIEKNVAFDLTITFNEPVNGFAAADLTLTGPATLSLSGAEGDAVYTATITPNANQEGDVTVRVNANAVQDLALNANTAASNAPLVHVDTIIPTVVLEDVPVFEKRNDVFEIKVIFSEAVNGFFQEPADLMIDGPITAELTAGAEGDAEYTVTITPNPTSKGDLTLQVNAAAVQDLALNDNTASAVSGVVRIDTVPPVAEITNLPSVAGGPFDVTITFNEQVNGFATEDIGLTGPATAVLKSGVDGDAIYTATLTPDPNSRGDVRIQIPAGVVKDLALNDNIASEISEAVHVDTNALTVQITDVPETVQLEAFSVMIKFSMDVADFVLADITISGDAVIQTPNLTGRGKVYLLRITPEADTDGDVTILVPANVATDAASNSNTASIPRTVSVAPKWMPAAGLRNASREVLGLDAGEDFERTELTKLTTLTSESTNIRTLTGLEAATNLTTLNLKGNAITDITLLRGLTKLTTLDLSGNAITDITTLGQLTELTTLDLSGNAITDITALAQLTALTTLNLSDNPISSLNPLSALIALTTLELSGNAINDLTVISDLTGLLTLDISDNSITDITRLGNLTALTTLDLSGNTVSILTPLAGLTQLRTLKLNNNTVSDLTSLGSLTNLTTLELSGNAISVLMPLATLQQLRLLDLSANDISDVSTLTGLASLTTLRLLGNPILNTKPLYSLTQRVPAVTIDIAISQYTPWDVNADGSVDALDSALVTVALGQSGEGILDPRTDVNGDGTVDNADLLLVTGNFDEVQGAPAVADILRLLDPETLENLDREVLETELQRLVLQSDGSLKYRRAIELLQRILAVQHPDQTRLFANYPNPFNPETWIPYQLAVGSKVKLIIYDVKGVVVQHLKLGHQPAGYYTQRNRAAYWDGRNAVGERVASGIYFYQLQAENVSLLRKMVILK